MAFCTQGSGSGNATAGNWQGTQGQIGVYILIGGLAFQFLAFSAYLCVFVRFHLTARHMAIREAPEGWMNVVKAVYISSSMIMVSVSRHTEATFADTIRSAAYIALPNSQRASRAMPIETNGCSGSLSVCRCSSPLPSFAGGIRADILARTVPRGCSPSRVKSRRRRSWPIGPRITKGWDLRRLDGVVMIFF